MGIGSKLMKWMKTIVLTSFMLVLVNGNPTIEFQACRGLRQGDPMSTFMFLLTAKGLVKIMYNASHLGDFKGFQVNEDMHFKLL